MKGYALNPSMPVLLRPDGAVQVGWDPRRAVLVRPPSGLSPTALAELLRTLQSGATLADLQARFGVDAGELVASLVAAGVVTTRGRRGPGHRAGDGVARTHPGRPGHPGGTRWRGRGTFDGAAADAGHHAGV